MRTRALLSIIASIALVAMGCETTDENARPLADMTQGDTATPLDTTGVDAAGDDTASYTDIVLPSDAVDGCPGLEPQTGDECAGHLSCSYGEECCCGQCVPSVQCECTSAGWACHATDGCLMVSCPDVLDVVDDVPGDVVPLDVALDVPPDTDVVTSDVPPDVPDVGPDVPPDAMVDTTELCPAEAPIGLAGCIDGAHCEYGEECCCGECFPSIVCDCQGGDSWSCYATDACMNPSCGCHDDADCGGGYGTCMTEDDPPVCGMCMEPELPCDTDDDCADYPGLVCDEPDDVCLCWAATVCTPACEADDECAAGESCLEGHCDPAPCADDMDCEAHFVCGDDGACTRAPCTDDVDCPDGYCVEGLCFATLGWCMTTFPP